MSVVDLVGPARTGCGFCGCRDPRHTVVELIVERVAAGEDPAVVAASLRLQEDVVRAVAAAGADGSGT